MGGSGSGEGEQRDMQVVIMKQQQQYDVSAVVVVGVTLAGDKVLLRKLRRGGKESKLYLLD